MYDKKFVELKKETLAYIEKGNGKKNIVLIHGNFSSSFALYPFYESCPKDYKMYGFDLRGFGDSTYNERFDTIDELADDIIEAIEVLKLDKVHLIGWSLGGAVCMKIAAKVPHLVETMSLIQSASYRGFPVFEKDDKFQDIYGHIYPSKEKLATDPVLVVPLLQAYAQKDRAFLDWMKQVSTWSKNRPSPEICDAYIDDQLKQRNLVDVDWALANFNMSGSSNMYSLGTNDIGNIKCRVFMTFATGDAVVSEQMTRENIAALKPEVVKVYEGEGHQVLYDRTKEVLEDIYTFIG